MKRKPRVRVTRNGKQVDYGPFEGEEAEIIRAAAAASVTLSLKLR